MRSLKGKDLINIGIYAAIYCVIMTAVAMLGFIPIMMPDALCISSVGRWNTDDVIYDKGG